MTLLNIDYKYFAGSKDPIEIINKYRMRGYTTLLNDSEKIRFVSYSNKVEKWNNLYGNIEKTDENSIKSIFGPRNLSDKLFFPRRVNKDLYKQYKPVEDKYFSRPGVPMNMENCDFGIDSNKVKTAFEIMNNLTSINNYGCK